MECSEKRYEVLQNYEFSEPTTSHERYEVVRQTCPAPAVRAVSLYTSPAAVDSQNCEVFDPSTLSLSKCHGAPAENEGTRSRKSLGYSVYAENFNRLLQKGHCTSRRKPNMMTDGEEEEVLYYGTDAGCDSSIVIDQGTTASCEVGEKQFRMDATQQISPIESASTISQSTQLSKPVISSQNEGLSKTSDAFGDPDRFKTKPAISYATLVALALKNSKNGCLTVQEVYDFVDSNFPFFRTANSGWKNSVRHNLSFSKYFMKIETRRGEGDSRRSYIWTVNPARSHELEQSLAKLMERDKENTLKCLANPEDFDAIRTGTLNFKFKRPIRRKPMVQIGRGDASMSRSLNRHHDHRFSSSSQFKYSAHKVRGIRGPRRVLSFGTTMKADQPGNSRSRGIDYLIDSERYESPPLPELTRLLNDEGDEIFHQSHQAPSLLTAPRFQPSLENQLDLDFENVCEIFNSSLKCDGDTNNELRTIDVMETDEQSNVQDSCTDTSQNSSQSEFPEPHIVEPIQLTPPKKWYSDCYFDDQSNIVSPGNDVMLSDAIINKSPEQEVKLPCDQWQFEPITPSRWSEIGVAYRTQQFAISRSHLLV